MQEIELETTYLAKFIPDGLNECKFKEIVDIYIPQNEEHSKLRLRKQGDKYQITKKTLLNSNDASIQQEETIILTQEEFESLSSSSNKKIEKKRYYYPYQWKTAEIDVFLWMLAWLVVVDFEFASIEEKNQFQIPNFCHKDVTQEKFIAGGVLAGKSYEDIEDRLKELGYKKLNM